MVLELALDCQGHRCHCHLVQKLLDVQRFLGVQQGRLVDPAAIYAAPRRISWTLRQVFLLPQDFLLGQTGFYIHIRNLKTARFARRQHCKIDDFSLLQFVDRAFGSMRSDESLFAGGPSAFRRRGNVVMQRLGVPCGARAGGVTLAVLRGCGATYFYLACGDLSRVQWRGRWSQLRTVERYIREVGAQTIVARRIKELGDASSLLLSMYLEGKLVSPKD